MLTKNQKYEYDFLKGVTGAVSTQTSMNLDTPVKNVTPIANTLAKKVITSAGVPLTN